MTLFEYKTEKFTYKYYIQFLIGLRPKVFIFENVPGLKTAGGGKYLKDMQFLMDKAGYNTKFKILNAADYGVPQNRKRVILVGWDKNLNKLTEKKIFKCLNFTKQNKKFKSNHWLRRPCYALFIIFVCE